MKAAGDSGYAVAERRSTVSACARQSFPVPDSRCFRINLGPNLEGLPLQRTVAVAHGGCATWVSSDRRVLLSYEAKPETSARIAAMAVEYKRTIRSTFEHLLNVNVPGVHVGRA